ncbi:MAG: hypothetical protein Q8Q31_02815 [Nanoarchaeota archaeon]|nr:hypothetical protein [Nanoarchaeota archaeon]
MKNLAVRYSKAQLKIQEMAFVIVAIIIFFFIAGIFVLNLWGTGLKKDVEMQRVEKAGEIALKIADSPELSWSSSSSLCENCIDLDKALSMKEMISQGSNYKDFWRSDISAIRIVLIHPKKTGECTKFNYPECGTITLFNKSEDFQYFGSYVSVCRYDEKKGGYFKCELGKIEVSPRLLE